MTIPTDIPPAVVGRIVTRIEFGIRYAHNDKIGAITVETAERFISQGETSGKLGTLMRRESGPGFTGEWKPQDGGGDCPASLDLDATLRDGAELIVRYVPPGTVLRFGDDGGSFEEPSDGGFDATVTKPAEDYECGEIFSEGFGPTVAAALADLVAEPAPPAIADNEPPF